MTHSYYHLVAVAVAAVVSGPVHAGQFVVELDAPFDAPPHALMQKHGLTVDETLSAGSDSYVIVSADTEDAVRARRQAFLSRLEEIRLRQARNETEGVDPVPPARSA